MSSRFRGDAAKKGKRQGGSGAKVKDEEDNG